MDNTAIDQATSAETFDVLSFVEQVAYPVEFVTVFTDVVAAREYSDEQKRWSSLKPGDLVDEEEHDQIISDLTERLRKSSLTFKLRGFPPGIVTELIEKHSTDENPGGADSHVMAKAIVSVTKGTGETDNSLWTPEMVERLKGNIAEGQFLKLLQGVATTVFNAAVFDQVADAGFSGRSTDVAPEL